MKEVILTLPFVVVKMLFFFLLLTLLPFTQSQLLDETDVHNIDTHWNHVTIRRLIDTRIHNKPNDYETKDNTEQGKNIAREWSGSIDPETDLDAFGRKVCKIIGALQSEMIKATILHRRERPDHHHVFSQCTKVGERQNEIVHLSF